MNTRVLIIHQSAILSEGLHKLLHNSPLQLHDHLRIMPDPAELNLQPSTNYIFITSEKLFSKLYSLHLINFNEAHYRVIKIDTNELCETESECDNVIHINETQNQIVDKIRCAANSFLPEKTSAALNLTERETEILKMVALGNASKEIADKLNISTHTVVTHRKNITEKLGIKSISGLTVYAILNKIIDTNELSIDDLI